MIRSPLTETFRCQIAQTKSAQKGESSTIRVLLRPLLLGGSTPCTPPPSIRRRSCLGHARVSFNLACQSLHVHTLREDTAGLKTDSMPDTGRLETASTPDEAATTTDRMQRVCFRARLRQNLLQVRGGEPTHSDRRLLFVDAAASFSPV